MVFLLARVSLAAKHGARYLLNSPSLPAITQTASIAGKATRDRTYPKPPPFPYNDRHLPFWLGWFQNPLWWFDENTKLLVVDGNIAAGKTDLAKKLAEELEMLYVPEPTMDDCFINSYGFDLRKLDCDLGPTARSCDVKKFYENPYDRKVAQFQIDMYKVRYMQHVDALCHIFNTGQGVILDRSVYSDFVFMEAMVKHGYLSPKVKKYYYELKKNSIYELMRPHLVIYLDVPPKIILERIQKRAIPYEAGSKVITKDYLQSLEDAYKEYLRAMNQHSQVLVYDWSNFGDAESVVEDIERVNVDTDKLDIHSGKLDDWRFLNYWNYVDARYKYTTRRWQFPTYFNVPAWDVPELLMDVDEAEKYWEVLRNAPGMKYAKGYNTDMGDTGLLFKLRTQPRT